MGLEVDWRWRGESQTGLWYLVREGHVAQSSRVSKLGPVVFSHLPYHTENVKDDFSPVTITVFRCVSQRQPEIFFLLLNVKFQGRAELVVGSTDVNMPG